MFSFFSGFGAGCHKSWSWGLWDRWGDNLVRLRQQQFLDFCHFEWMQRSRVETGWFMSLLSSEFYISFYKLAHYNNKNSNEFEMLESTSSSVFDCPICLTRYNESKPFFNLRVKSTNGTALWPRLLSRLSRQDHKVFPFWSGWRGDSHRLALSLHRVSSGQESPPWWCSLFTVLLRDSVQPAERTDKGILLI